MALELRPGLQTRQRHTGPYCTSCFRDTQGMCGHRTTPGRCSGMSSQWQPAPCMPGKSFGFNWRIMALHCCAGFCCTAAWISHNYIHTPPFWALLSPSHLSDHLRVSGWAPCVMQQLLTSYLFHMIVYIRQHCFLNLSHPLLSLLLQKSLPYICNSISSLELDSSVLFLWIPYLSTIYLYIIIIWYLFFSF